MKIVIATKNNGKLREFKRILEPMGYEVLSQADVGVDTQAEETGLTFEENAYLKAKHIFDATGLITVADDSGLCVEALNGRPGVFSARYAGENATDEQRVEKLLSVLNGVQPKDRGAYFVCAICAIFPDEIWNIEKKCVGIISFEPDGQNGFGYDPIFFVDGKSFSAMTDEEKDLISHRGQALREFAFQMKNRRRMNDIK